MNSSRWLEYSFNFLFWLVTAWLISSSFSIQAQEIELVDGVETLNFIRSESLIHKLLYCIALAAAMFYTNLWNILRLQDGQQRRSVALLALVLFIGTIGLYTLLESCLAPWPSIPLPPAVRNGILLFYITISTAYGLAKVWLRAVQQQQELIVARKQAELQLLRNQLQPHFLFNALNNLLALVDQQQSPLLATSIERLSQLLRYVIDETQKGSVTVRQEIEFIRNYVDVQLLRFEPHEVDFDLVVKGDNDQQFLEPGLFIPFVENAFKYGTEPEQKARIRCVFDLRNSGEVHFTIRNKTFLRNATTERIGTGIAGVRKRLEWVYPERHQLEVRDDEFFTVDLNIRTHEGDNR